MTGLSDEALAQKIYAGDSEAERIFARRFERPLRLWLRRREQLQDAELDDLVQETLLTVLLQLRNGRLEQAERLGAYVYQAAKYLHVGGRRKQTRQAGLLNAYGDPRAQSDPPSPEREAERRRLGEIVGQVLRELPVARDRSILRLRYLLGLDKAVICSLLELDERHFDRVIARARKRFRELWAAKVDSEVTEL